jgi:hypothetical protein
MNAPTQSPVEKLQPVAKAAARRRVAGGAGLGRHHSREAQCQAATIMEVLAGARTPDDVPPAVEGSEQLLMENTLSDVPLLGQLAVARFVQVTFE